MHFLHRENGLGEKNTLAKQRSAKNVKVRKIKFCAMFPPEETILSKQMRMREIIWRVLGCVRFPLFLHLWIHFLFNGKYRRLERAPPAVSDGRKHMFAVMLASDCNSPAQVSSSPYIEVCAIVGTLLEVEKKQCPFEARLWTLHEPLGIM